MLDPEAKVLRLVRLGTHLVFLHILFGLREGIQRHLHGAIADGMKTNLEARSSTLSGHLVELIRLVAR